MPRTSPRAEETMRELAAAGIDMASVTKQLELEGVKSFSDSYTSLIKTTEEKVAKAARRGRRWRESCRHGDRRRHRSRSRHLSGPRFRPP